MKEIVLVTLAIDAETKSAARKISGKVERSGGAGPGSATR
jgi:hypothetical protein